MPDIFFTGNTTPNKLYLNKGNFEFEDITAGVGLKGNPWSTGVTMSDVNNDGYLDIYVNNAGPTTNSNLAANQLYINKGDNTFIEKASAMGVADMGNSIQSVFFDYDKDGDLDLFVMNHSELITNTKRYHDWIKTVSDEDVKRLSNSLYQNNGNGTFSDVTASAGVQKVGFGLGLVASDLNHDGNVDLYVANDYFIPDFMFINNGDGTFTDKINTQTSHTSFYSMGCDAADINNDGWIDLGIVDMAPYDHIRSKRLMPSMDVNEFRWLTLKQKYQSQYMFNAIQVNNGLGVFSDIGHYVGVAKTDWSWTALFADIDNDGRKDYIVTNGFKRDTKDNDLRARMRKVAQSNQGESNLGDSIWEELQTADVVPLPNYIYQNQESLKFVNKAVEWGFDQPSFSNGAAYADLDNDGDLDIVVNNIDTEAFVYRNNAQQLNGNNHIQFQLKNGNRSTLNSKVTIHTSEGIQFWESTPTRGYQSAVQNIAHFGLGNLTAVDKVVIEWNDGKETTIQNPVINQLNIIQKDKQPLANVSPKNQDTPFLNITSQSGINFKHQENIFDDFAKEILLPHSQSQLGPLMAVGDVNKDGFDDFYVGGAKGQSGMIYIQDYRTGKFVQSPNQPWQKHANSEDMGCQFFDADNDNDLDLYVASGGGGDFENESHLLQDRLYLNDGYGVFSDATNQLPKFLVSSGRVKTADFDGDGDLDVFVGGRTNPGTYPKPVSSYLLQNNNGKFVDVSTKNAPMLKNIGMVTDAQWTDYDKDGDSDLIIVGEWMPVTLLKNTNGQFENVSEVHLDSPYHGWWFNIEALDVDNDGDDDYIVGNLGENNKFKPSDKKPLHVFGNDFDQNGTLDIVLSVKYKDKLVPVRGKECSSQQMPFLAEKFPTFKEFAEAKLDDVYDQEKLDEALSYQVKSFKSILLINEGLGKWQTKPLPYQTQFFPITSIIAHDFSGDGLKDLLLAGNMFNTEVETTAYDAGKGLYLISNGDGTFSTTLDATKTGLFIPNNVKDLRLIQITPEKRPGILVGNNNFSTELLIYLKERAHL